MVRAVFRYEAEDGTLFTNEGDGERYEMECEFKKWCDKYICRGGEWSARMVSNAILENWKVTRIS